MSQSKKFKKSKPSDSINLDESMAIAQGIKQESQTKAQTKLVAQGIRKGIELYKNQQNKKQRDSDKARKKDLKEKLNKQSDSIDALNQDSGNQSVLLRGLPWLLLTLSWVVFVVYIQYYLR